MAYDGTLKFDTKLDPSGFKSGLIGLGELAKTGVKTLAATIGAVSAAFAAGGGAAVKVGANFEAGMSQVEAISGAAGEELEALTQKAKEMGAKTKFSASESAQAFQYMAMAGWKSENMLSGIEGIMNLAAASGEDLAGVSDIVTDALTAFGLQAKDSAHFADVLAKASSSSNTNVGLMGSTFKYVAPVAGALKYDIEDVAVAIGLMANAGIKGEQAGTQLRGVLSRMSLPTDKVQTAMDKLGVSLTDSKGNMKSFSEVVVDLRKGFSRLTDSEKTTYAAMLGGQEAMSGLLAIANASEEEFASLTEAISNSDGTAQQMADTMNDNLQGAFTIMKSAAEGFGITVYESMQEPLKSLCRKGTEYLDELTKAFESGGLSAVAEKSGEIFGEIAVKAAEEAPKIVGAAVSFIKAFVGGIQKNRDTLMKAVKEIVSVIVDGLVSLLPKQVQAPVKKTVEALKKSFQDGGLKNAIRTIGRILENLGKIVTSVAEFSLPILVSVLDFLGNNLEWILPLAGGFFAAFKAYTIIKSVTGVLSALTAVTTAESIATAASTGALTLKQAAVGVLSGQIGLATAAQWLWNAAMSANPIGLVIGLVAGLATGVGLLALSMDDCMTEDLKLLKRLQETTEAIETETQAYKDLVDENAKKAEADLAQIDHVEKLWKELDRLADSNGEVKESDKARADFILNQLNDALGTEYQMTGNVIDNYNELRKSIANVIDTKKAEILLNAHQEDYEEAVKKITEADKQRSDAAIKVSEQMQKKTELEKEYQQLLIQLEEEYGKESATYQLMAAQRKEGLDKDLANIEWCLSETQKMYDAADEQYQTYYNNIQSYEEANALMLEGKSDEAVELLRRQSNAHLETAETVKGSKEEQIEALKEQAVSLEAYARTLEEKYKAGVKGVTEEMVKDARERADQANEIFYEAGGEGIQKYVDGTLSQGYRFSDSLEKTIDDAVAYNKNKAIYGGKETGSAMMSGVIDGVKAAKNAINSTMGVIVGNALDAAKKAAEIHSPSRLFKREVGRNIGLGVASGIEESGEEVEQVAEEQIDSLRAAYSRTRLDGMVSTLRGVFRQGTARLSAVGELSVQRFLFASEEREPIPAGETVYNQYITFEQPMQAPDEIARELRIAQKYGLAGAR